ncbi:MAG: hypothetical protein AB7N76_24910 [Planctomycetota bacterium]
MDPASLLIGVVVGLVACWVLFHTGERAQAGTPPPPPPLEPPPAEPRPTGGEVPGPVEPPPLDEPPSRPAEPATAQEPDQPLVGAPPPVEPPPVEPPPREPPAQPRFLLVAYRCPQCGGGVELPEQGRALTCPYCDVAIHVEERAPAASAEPARPARPRPGREDEPPPYAPPHPHATTRARFGRFEVVVARQAIHARPREVMRWLPLGERFAALFLVRVLHDEEPLDDPALLEQVATALEERLRERRDPGLAARAALRALRDASPEAGELEVFAAVFDADKSQVLTYDAGCPGALWRASVEEGRLIDPVRDRGRLKVLDLRGEADAFANGPRLELAAGDGVLVTSAGVAGEGRGWRHGQRSLFQGLGQRAIGRDPGWQTDELFAAYWRDRERARAATPPVGDLLVVALRVLGNKELGTAPPPLSREPRTFETATFSLALLAAPEAFVQLREVRPRCHALTWLEGEGLDLAAAGPRFAERLEALLGGETGDNDNPRRGGREGLAAAGLEPESPGLRALALFLGDEHAKVAFWLRGWSDAPLVLPVRGERGGNLQVFDEGGHVWPSPGARLLFSAGLPFAASARAPADLGGAWPGGRASALYELALEHEEEGTAAALLRAVAGAVGIDIGAAPEKSGLLVVERRVVE